MGSNGGFAKVIGKITKTSYSFRVRGKDDRVREDSRSSLRGRRFRVGAVLLEATRLNFPCKYLELVTSKPVYEPLIHRSGLNCIIVEGGNIRPGDRLTPA